MRSHQVGKAHASGPGTEGKARGTKSCTETLSNDTCDGRVSISTETHGPFVQYVDSVPAAVKLTGSQPVSAVLK